MLNSEHILPLIMRNGVLNKKLALVHRMLMVEAVNTTMGGNAQEVHDELLEYILQVRCPCLAPTFLCTHLPNNESIGLYIPLQFSRKLVYINRCMSAM